MPLGTFLGGAGAVRAQNMNAEANQAQVGLQAQQNQAAAHENLAKRYDEMVKQSLDIADKTFAEAYKKGDPATVQSATAAVSQIQNHVMEVGKQLNQAGVIDGQRMELTNQLFTASMTPRQTSQEAANLAQPVVPVTKDGKNVYAERNTAAGQEVAYPPTAAPTTNVIFPQEKLVNKGEEAATTTFGTDVGKRAGDRVTYAQEGIMQNQQLDRLKLAISQGAVTGAGAETLLDLKSIASTFEIDVSTATAEGEVMRRIQAEMALRMRNPESGLGLTGNTSNKDLSFLTSSVPGLSKTKQGNIAIIDAMMRLNKMKADIAAYQSSVIAQHGGSVPLDLDSSVLEYVNKYQMYSKDEMKQIQSLTKMEKDPSSMSDDELLKALNGN